MTDIELDQPVDALLRNIIVAAGQRHMPGMALVPHGVLVAKLAKESQSSIARLQEHITMLNQRNGWLQRVMVGLTLATLLLAGVQVWVALKPANEGSLTSAAVSYAECVPSPSAGRIGH